MNNVELSTLGHLQFEKFNIKDETVPSVGLPFSTFVNTKQSYQSNMPIPFSGAQILGGVEKILTELIPDSKREWGNIFVYKNKYSAPDYVKKLTGNEPAGIKQLSKDTPITDLHFPRFIGTIDLVGDGQYSERLAIKCDDNKNIQLAIGLNVNICQNFTLFGENLLSTNTRERKDFDWIMSKIREYCKSIEKKFGYDLETIKRLQDQSVTLFERDRFVGDLLMRYETENEILPVTMITDYSRGLKLTEVDNAWQLLNVGTERVRFDSNTGDSILETMNNFANFTLQSYGIPYEYELAEQA